MTISQKQQVPPEGPVDAVIAFVGSSPNAIEALRGRLFLGPIGEIFKGMYLDPLGVKREDVFITSAVPQFLGREPTDEEINEFRPWLDSELEKARPKTIVALGCTALKALGDKADIVMPHPRNIQRSQSVRKLAALEELKDLIQKNLNVDPDIGVVEKQLVVFKQDEEKREVTGIVLQPDVVDAQGDIISAEEIEQAAHDWLMNSRVIGDSHRKEAQAQVVESWIAPSSLEIDGQDIPKGAWLMTVKVLDDRMWEAVKSGDYGGFSIGGSANREAT